LNEKLTRPTVPILDNRPRGWKKSIFSEKGWARYQDNGANVNPQ